MSAASSLAALLFMELDGFGDLLNSEERQALELLGRYRKAIEPVIESHGGEIMDVTGSELLVVFGSAVAAVQCSLHLALAVRGALGGESRMRCGLHMGEVWRESGKLYGNGVNLAARVMQAAVPGSMLASEDIYRQVATKLDLNARAVPALALKNIDRPLELYEIDTGDGLHVPPDRPAVRAREPGVNSSDDPASLAEDIKRLVAEALRRHADIDFGLSKWIEPLAPAMPPAPKFVPPPAPPGRLPHHHRHTRADSRVATGSDTGARSLSIDLSFGDGIHVSKRTKLRHGAESRAGDPDDALDADPERRRSKAARDISSGVKSLVFNGLAGAAFMYGFIRTDSPWYLAGAVLIGLFPALSGLRKIVLAGSELRGLEKEEQRDRIGQRKR